MCENSINLNIRQTKVISRRQANIFADAELQCADHDNI